jgi:hypothetical protein
MTPAALNTGNRNLFLPENPIANGDYDTIDTGTDETLPPLLALPQSKSVTRTANRSPPLALHQWASIDTCSVAAVTWDEFLPPDGYRKTPGLLQPSLA